MSKIPVSPTRLDIVGMNGNGAYDAFFKEHFRQSQDFLEFLNEKSFRLLVDFTNRFHQSYRRKVSGSPYAKHLYYSAYLGWQSAEFTSYNLSNRRVFIGALLLHDAIELKRKEKGSSNFGPLELFNEITPVYENTDELAAMVTIASLMTPEKKNPNSGKVEWLKAKKDDFLRIMEDIKEEHVIFEYSKISTQRDGNSLWQERHFRQQFKDPEDLVEMIRQVKICDEAANLRETVDDINKGSDGFSTYIKGLKPLDWRKEDFIWRVDYIKKKYKSHAILEFLEEGLDYIRTEFSKFYMEQLS